MRMNMPVTNVEQPMREGELIVSRTDTRGIITYVNQYFLDISGFTAAEILGSPHNIVRHPDMPAEAFEDLWRTLQAGRPWVGYVKNRCKNGDHYWVIANVTPIWEGNQITGYLSVRRKPDAAMVAKVAEVYRLFKEGRQGKLKIRYGQAVKPGLWDRFRDMSVGTKMWAGIGTVLALAAIAIGTALYGMRLVDNTFGHYIEREQKLLDGYSEMYAQGLQMGQALRNIILDPRNEKAYANLAKAEKDFQAGYDSARAAASEREAVRKQLDEVARLRSEQAKIGTAIVQAVRAGDAGQAQLLLNSKETPLWRAIKDHLLEGRKTLQEDALSARNAVSASASRAGLITLLAGLVALIAGALLSWRMVRGIREPLAEMDGIFRNMLQGNFSNVINIARNDEIGKTLQGLQVMQTRLGFDVAEIQRKAEEMALFKAALDSSTAAITVSGRDGLLKYMTGAGKRLMTSIGGPGFNVDDLMGQKLTNLFSDPEAAARLDQAAQSGRDVEFVFKDHHLKLAARPIVDDKGTQLGRVSQWTDRTAEVVVEHEVSNLVQAAAAGDFSRRISLEGKDGFFKQLATGINQVVETSEQGVSDVGEVLKALSEGDLTRQMTGDYQGLFAELRDNANATVARLQEIIG
ncbi:MAG: PAS domain-containing protein, partial [Pseudomonadota bacterium]